MSQVNEAVSLMDRVTQNNATETEELQRMADRLAGHATKLDTLLERFTLSSGNGGHTEARPTPSPRVPVQALLARPARRPPLKHRPAPVRDGRVEVR